MESELLFELTVSDKTDARKIIELEKKGVKLTHEHLFILHCICNNIFLINKNKNLMSDIVINRALKYCVLKKSYEAVEILIKTGKIEFIFENALDDDILFNMFISNKIYKLQDGKDIYSFCLSNNDRIKTLLRNRIEPSTENELFLMEYEEFIEFFPEIAIYYIDENSNLINKLDSFHSRLLMNIAIKNENSILLDKLLKRNKGINIKINGKTLLDEAGIYFNKIVCSDIDFSLIAEKLFHTDNYQEAKILLTRFRMNNISEYIYEELITYSYLADDGIRELIEEKIRERR